MAHILNAEGEKLQVVVAQAGVSAETLLAVNASVRSMVSEISMLEIVLQKKLALFETCIPNCDEIVK